MLHARRLGSLRDVLGLSLFFLCGKMLPKIRYAIHSVGSRKRFLEAFDVIQICLNDLRSLRSERLCVVLVRIARDCPKCEATIRISQDRPSKPAALRTRRPDD